MTSTVTKVTRVERRKRGFFGWVFLILFLAFNAIMLFSTVAGLSGGAEEYGTLTSDAERAGYAIGTTVAVGMLLGIWGFGALILGLLALLTRGSKVIVETHQ